MKGGRLGARGHRPRARDPESGARSQKKDKEQISVTVDFRGWAKALKSNTAVLLDRGTAILAGVTGNTEELESLHACTPGGCVEHRDAPTSALPESRHTISIGEWQRYSHACTPEVRIAMNAGEA